MSTQDLIKTALVAATFSIAVGAQAQDPVDIGLYEGSNGELEVRVIPNADFDGVFSSVVFTLKWDASTEATLARPLQSDEARENIAIQASGVVREERGYNYQVYSGIGLQNMGELGRSWTAGVEYTIARIPVNGYAAVELADDDWTHELRNNGDYFVSLGGFDRTGVITKALAIGGSPAFSVSVLPNPNNGHFTLGIEVPEEQDIDFELVNTGGEVVFTQQLRGSSGRYRKEMDFTGLSSGVYHLNVRQADKLVVRKVVIQ